MFDLDQMGGGEAPATTSDSESADSDVLKLRSSAELDQETFDDIHQMVADLTDETANDDGQDRAA